MTGKIARRRNATIWKECAAEEISTWGERIECLNEELQLIMGSVARLESETYLKWCLCRTEKAQQNLGEAEAEYKLAHQDLVRFERRFRRAYPCYRVLDQLSGRPGQLPGS